MANYDPIIAEPTWRGTTALYTVRKLGLSGGLEMVLDAGDAESYSTGQTWLDVSGNSNDFFRGPSGTATAADPTFNGTAGGRSVSEYWSFDGGDYFERTSVPTWMENMHKNNAVFTLSFWVHLPNLSAAQVLFTTLSGGSAATSTGMQLAINATTGAPSLFSANAAGTDTGITATTTAVSAGAWTMVSLALDESIGANGVTYQIDGAQEHLTSTYTAPAAGAASGNPQIGIRGTSVAPLLNGARLGMALGWSRKLSDEELMALYHATRIRYEV